MEQKSQEGAKRPDPALAAWMADPLVKDIPKEKLDFLGEMFAQSQGKSQKELMASLLPMMTLARQKNLTFSPQEMTAAISAIRSHASQEELQKIDHILAKTKS